MYFWKIKGLKDASTEDMSSYAVKINDNNCLLLTKDSGKFSNHIKNIGGLVTYLKTKGIKESTRAGFNSLDLDGLLEDTALIVNSIPETVTIEGTGTYEINVTTNPSEATIEVASDTEGVATATVEGKKVTITGVTAGSAIVKITTKATGYQSFTRTVLVIVK